MGIETAIIGGAIFGAGASAYSANKAAKAQQAGYDAATAEQARQYDQTREDFAPWREAGVGALNKLTTPNKSFRASPGYQFRRDEGIRDVGNFYSAKGAGGNALKALAEWNQNMASNEFGNWWNRQAGLAGVGQAATGATAAAGSVAAANTSNALIGSANARASGIQNVNNAFQQGLGNYLYYRGYGGGGGGAPAPAGYWSRQAEIYGG